MEEKYMVGLALMFVNFIALGVLGRFSPRLFWPVDWFPRWPKKVPPTPPAPAERVLPESGVVIHHKILCDCQHGCKSGECDK